jgi:hypothetical protein
MKTEPSEYSFALQRDRNAVWDGMSNPVAVKNLQGMKTGRAARHLRNWSEGYGKRFKSPACSEFILKKLLLAGLYQYVIRFASYGNLTYQGSFSAPEDRRSDSSYDGPSLTPRNSRLPTLWPTLRAWIL